MTDHNIVLDDGPALVLDLSVAQSSVNSKVASMLARFMMGEQPTADDFEELVTRNERVQAVTMKILDRFDDDGNPIESLPLATRGRLPEERG